MKKKIDEFDEFEKAQMGEDYAHIQGETMMDRIVPKTRIKLARKDLAETLKKTIKEAEQDFAKLQQRCESLATGGKDVNVLEGELVPEAVVSDTAIPGPVAELTISKIEAKEASIHSIFGLLEKLSEGDCITYRELSSNCGRDVRFAGRRDLSTARLRLEDMGRAFSPTRIFDTNQDPVVMERGVVRVRHDREMLDKASFWIKEGMRKLKRSLRYLEMTDKYRLDEEDRERLIRGKMAVESALTFLNDEVVKRKE